LELRQLTGKVQQLRAIQSQYKQIIPATLYRSSHVLRMDQGNLILSADNGSIAAKLRQMAPELIRLLQLNDCEVTGIQVKVQVTVPLSTTCHSPSSLSAQGKQQLNKLAESLNDSPLKKALTKLASSK